ncbi:nucleoside 2-deoxyribosyltransferase [Oceanobacillus halotolerans]|uniref:nucleoside 2-deoxyribosyltransferase n=1 Tax=Oceanobacillus halotolerans TaxID=2663380 RepID=UPI0013DD0AA7|nr:nucleoside 2-deoxyribosyltransferase [Oceanobacillus halotolerans]
MKTTSKSKREERRNEHIYIAGPDFPQIDTKPIDDIYEALAKQHFTPRRPIQENGLVTGEETEEEKLAIYEKDIRLQEECSMLVVC